MPSSPSDSITQLLGHSTALISCRFCPSWQSWAPHSVQEQEASLLEKRSQDYAIVCSCAAGTVVSLTTISSLDAESFSLFPHGPLRCMEAGTGQDLAGGSRGRNPTLLGAHHLSMGNAEAVAALLGFFFGLRPGWVSDCFCLRPG